MEADLDCCFACVVEMMGDVVVVVVYGDVGGDVQFPLYGGYRMPAVLWVHTEVGAGAGAVGEMMCHGVRSS